MSNRLTFFVDEDEEISLDFDYDNMDKFKLLLYSVLSGVISLRVIEFLEGSIESEEDLKILDSLKTVIEFRESQKSDPLISPLDFGRVT
jgi:hypothetical protein